MSLAVRVIPCLDVDAGRVVKGINFEQLFIPLTVGGGVTSTDDVDRLLRAGADKIAVNTAAIARPELVAEIADRFGNQVLVLSVDARRAPGTDSGFEVTTHGGRRSAGLDALEWAHRAAELGAGEIPVIASGGAGRVEHFPPAVDAGADAVLAATVFHFGTLRISEVKKSLAEAG